MHFIYFISDPKVR